MILRVLALLATVAVTVTADFDLLLLHINDIHSRFDETDVHSNDYCIPEVADRGMCYGGVGRVAEVVRAERQLAADKGLPSMFVVAGDIFQGTPYFTFFKWQICSDVVNELKPDAMTLGNHEFDDDIQMIVKYLNHTENVPIVVSNLNMMSHPDLNKLVVPSYVFTMNGTKIGVVGYLTTECKASANFENIIILNEIQSLNKEIKKLRDNGVNIIIALGHSGIEMDRIVAREVEDIDIIVGGHSHTFLYSDQPPSTEIPYAPYPLYETNIKSGKSIPIVQAYAYTKYIGKAHLKFDSKGDLINFDGAPMLLDNKIKKSQSMLKVIDKWKSLISKLTNVIVGRSAVELSNNCSLDECNLGNLIADSYVFYNLLNKDLNSEYWTDSPIGIIHAGGIRNSIKSNKNKGYISMRQLITVIPFLRKLVKVTINGSSLLEVFEHSAYNYGKSSNKNLFLQVSGVEVEYDLSQKPGNRVSSLYLRCGNCAIPKFEPLVLTANYTILLNAFLAKGGDNYQSFKKIVKPNEIINIDDYNVTSIYTQIVSPIMTGIEGRIKFKSNREKSKASNIMNNKSTLVLSSIFILSKYLFCNNY